MSCSSTSIVPTCSAIVTVDCCVPVARVLAGYTYLSHSSVAVDSAFHFLRCDSPDSDPEELFPSVPTRRLLVQTQ